ncbi:hypothetical protein HF521_007352 [Silurus meridionalis]|uniref:Uncharacterized protein n=1 Tax=Silurus meridionalis TaxID=175797 RepID=A0A8T0AV62_SILME|nr:hypothetical protein HF521_007352 [Silurus meridionalis]
METAYFRNNFWGEKNAGFDVLYHNMKHGQIATKELAEFVRERDLNLLRLHRRPHVLNGNSYPMQETRRFITAMLKHLHAR